MKIDYLLNLIPISQGLEAHIDLVRRELFDREVKLMRSTICEEERLIEAEFLKMIEEAEKLNEYLNQNDW